MQGEGGDKLSDEGASGWGVEMSPHSSPRTSRGWMWCPPSSPRSWGRRTGATSCRSCWTAPWSTLDSLGLPKYPVLCNVLCPLRPLVYCPSLSCPLQVSCPLLSVLSATEPLSSPVLPVLSCPSCPQAACPPLRSTIDTSLSGQTLTTAHSQPDTPLPPPLTPDT